MAVEKGSAFLLKVGNGAAPVVYATVGVRRGDRRHSSTASMTG